MYHLIAIAGTFDRLHKGHRYFISEAFKLGEKVIVGLTSEKYVEGKLKAQSEKLKAKVNSYETRKKELEEFLKKEKLLDRAKIAKIDDVYGPTIEETKIEALVVTRETLGGARLVNKKRKYKGLKSLKILQTPLIMAQDSKKIASTRIRLGEIDRWGRAFSMQFTNYQLPITNELRQELKKPLGILIKGNPENLTEIVPKLKEKIYQIEPVMIITVGDEVTKLCNQIGITVNLAVIDYKVGREEKYHNLEELGFTLFVIPRSEATRDLSRMRARTSREIPRYARNDVIVEVSNPPGHITRSLAEAVKISYLHFIKDGRQKIIRVIGEEDLAGVPAILLCPLGSVVLYGQPGEGIVIVEIIEEKKQKLVDLIRNN